MAFNQFNSDQELPYAVFDTSTTPNVFSGPARRITWTVNASRHSEPIRLESLPQAIQLSKSPTPWPVFYDHRIRVSVRSFATDIVNSIYGQSGYLRAPPIQCARKSKFRKVHELFLSDVTSACGERHKKKLLIQLLDPQFLQRLAGIGCGLVDDLAEFIDRR